jgi:hypothetical protein
MAEEDRNLKANLESSSPSSVLYAVKVKEQNLSISLYCLDLVTRKGVQH